MIRLCSLLLLMLAGITSCTTSRSGDSPPGTVITLLAKDFPYEGSDFYLDRFTGTELLAINPEQKKTAAISQRFLGESGRYDVIFYGIGENDGRSAFEIFVNDKSIGKTVLPLSNESWEAGEAYNLRMRNVRLRAGNEIIVQGKVGTDGQEYSRARWLKLELVRR